MVTSQPKTTLTSATSPRCRRRSTINVPAHLAARDGVSIIEVLTSIVVAMIGVVGVMVLIPFAVRQAQTGLDLDDGYSLGQTAVDEFVGRGYTNPIAWAGSQGPAGPSPAGSGQLWSANARVGMVSEGDVFKDQVPYSGNTALQGVNSSSTALGQISVIPYGQLDLPFGVVNPQPRPFIMDPLGVMENTGLATDPFEAAKFPFQMIDAGAISGFSNITPFPIWRSAASMQGGSTVALPQFGLGFPALTLRNTFPEVGQTASFNPPLSKQQVRNLMRSTNDLVFGLPTAPGVAVDPIDPQGKLYPPVQLMDQVSQVSMRRQVLGAMSWAGLILPNRDPQTPTPRTDIDAGQTQPNGFTMHVMVFKDRDATNIPDPSTAANGAIAVPAGSMAVTQVNMDPSSTLSHLNAGVVSPMNRINLPVPTTAVSKDDWVMLINRGRTNGYHDPIAGGIIADPIPDSTGMCMHNDTSNDNFEQLAETGYERQVAFYRVRGVTTAIDPSTGNQTSSIDIEGPDFDFGDNTDADFTNDKGPTYIVHLKDVVNVYERTFSFEQESSFYPKN